MLSPFPKSTVISPGMPRKARMTSRWTFSVTGDFLEEQTNGLRSVGLVLLQNLLEATGEIRREILQRVEQRLEELVRVRAVHGQLSSPLPAGAKRRRSVRASVAARQ